MAETTVISIPIAFRRQGGRKTVVTPSSAPAWSAPPPRIDNTIAGQGRTQSRVSRLGRSLPKMHRINTPLVERGVGAGSAQSPLGLRLRDQIRVKVSASSSSKRLA